MLADQQCFENSAWNLEPENEGLPLPIIAVLFKLILFIFEIWRGGACLFYRLGNHSSRRWRQRLTVGTLGIGLPRWH